MDEKFLSVSASKNKKERKIMHVKDKTNISCKRKSKLRKTNSKKYKKGVNKIDSKLMRGEDMTFESFMEVNKK